MLRVVLATAVLLLTACRPLGYQTLDESDVVVSIFDDQFGFDEQSTYAVWSEVVDLDLCAAPRDIDHADVDPLILGAILPTSISISPHVAHAPRPARLPLRFFHL